MRRQQLITLLNGRKQWPFQRVVALTLLVTLLLMSLVLAACGGTTLPEPTMTPAAAAEIELAEQATAEQEPVEADPTEPPAPTDLPPTEPPPPTEAPPEPTEEPAVELVGGNCANPYYPVTEGRTLVYQTSDPLGGTTTYSITYGNSSDGGFTATFDLEGETEPITLQWTCTEDGLLSPNLSSLLGDTAGLEIEVVEASGVTLPSADEMVVGASWSTVYDMRMTMTDETVGVMSISQMIESASEIVGEESVTVPYGTFPNALRIDTTGNVAVSFDLEGTPMAAPGFEIRSTSWYVEGIGMVRDETPDLTGTGAGPNVIELVDVVDAP